MRAGPFVRRLTARLAVIGYIRKKRKSLRANPSASGRMDLRVAEILHNAYRLGRRKMLSGFLFPTELAHAYGVLPMFTETLGAITAGSPFASAALETAEERGYSRDGCSFHRAALGAGLAGFLPHFDLIVATSHLCDGQNKTLEALADEYGVRYLLLDMPQEQSPAALDYVAGQLAGIERELQRITGRKARASDWRRVFVLSNEARGLMLRIAALRQRSPAPLYGKRAFNIYFQSLLMFGTKFLCGAFRQLEAEMAAAPVGTDLGEKYRIVWLLAYPYFRGDFIPYLERELGVHAVAEELNQAFWPALDPERPLSSLAEKMLANPQLGPVTNRVALIERLVREYRADGVLHYSHFGCRQGCGGVRPIADAMRRIGVPFLELDGDCVDNRNYSEGQTRTRLEGFVELMGERNEIGVSRTQGRDLYLGIDIGSLSAKAAVVDREGGIVASELIYTGASSRKATARLREMILDGNGLADRIAACVATGYGRNAVDYADARITEITCHARGMAHLIAGVRTIIDIGGQDTKAIAVEADGAVVRFLMNDKCAAGTGRFLEVMARTLEIDLEDFGPRALQADKATTISSMCTVFAESEVVSLIADGMPIEEIARGVCDSIASRTVALLERVGKRKKIAMSGGVAKNVGVVRAIERALGTRLVLPPEPQLVGAIGAALIARED